MDKDEDKDIDLEENNEEEEAELESEDSESDDTDWKAEALKYKSMARRYKQKTIEKQETQPEKKEQEPLQVNRVEDKPILDEAVDLRLDGYTKDEVLFILQNGGRRALDTPDSYVSLAIKTKREQRRAEEEASKAKDTSQMTGVTKKYTTEQLAKMSSKDLAKILPHSEE